MDDFEDAEDVETIEDRLNRLSDEVAGLASAEPTSTEPGSRTITLRGISLDLDALRMRVGRIERALTAAGLFDD